MVGKSYLSKKLSFVHFALSFLFNLRFSSRYLSLHDNKFIRYFTGHTKKVISLQMSPVDDTFMSGSLDNTVRLWDLRSPTCAGLMNVNGKPVCAFDPEGNQHQKAMSGASSTSSQYSVLVSNRNILESPPLFFSGLTTLYSG